MFYYSRFLSLELFERLILMKPYIFSESFCTRAATLCWAILDCLRGENKHSRLTNQIRLSRNISMGSYIDKVFASKKFKTCRSVNKKMIKLVWEGSPK